MEKIILLTISISSVFIILKMIEIKYLENKTKPMKEVIRDALIIAISSFSVLYGFSQFNQSIPFLSDNVEKMTKQPDIFTDNPGF